MNTRYLFPMFILIIMLVTIGCSGSMNPIEITDSQSSEDIPSELINNESSRSLIGRWDIEFDKSNLQAEISAQRDILQHLNATIYLPPPQITVVDFNPITGILDVDITLVNNTPYSAYDLRIIVFSDNYGVRLRNADNWTSHWDIPGGSFINPFKAFAKTEINRIFATMTQHTERLQIFMPSGITNVSWAIDASFPDNCHEPYLIDTFTQGRLSQVQDSKTRVTIDVYDWQDDIESVGLYCPSITDEVFVEFDYYDDNTWVMDLYNNTGATPGDYTGIIVADSSGACLYDYVTIRVSEQTTAKWTVFCYFWDADLTPWVSVNVNEMEVVGSIEDEVNFVVLREEDFGLDQYILEIAKDPDGYNETIISPRIDDYGEVIKPGGVNFGDYHTLIDYLNWGIREYPAERYGLILFGHGSGPFQIVPGPPPWLSFVHGMQVWTLRDAVQAVLDTHPEIDKLEFIHFESCLMGWFETAYGLKDVTRVGVASEMVMSGYTVEYDVVFGEFVDNIDTWQAHDFSGCYVRNYLESTGFDTLAAWDTGIADTRVIVSLDNFAQELLNALPDYRAVIETCRNETGNWGAWCNDAQAIDLGYFAEIVISKDDLLPPSLIDAATVLRDDIEDAVFEHGHNGEGTGCFYNETGWQLWFPRDYDDPKYDQRKSNYESLGIDSLLWDDFLDAFDE